MLQMTPTLNFHGCCKEAMALYAHAFDTKLDFLIRYAEANPLDWHTPLSDKEKDLIYHAEMHIGTQRLMFADVLEFDPNHGTSLSLTVTFDSAEDVRRTYERMYEGSTIIYPMYTTTYSSCIVVFIDRFGIRWGLMTEQTER